MILSNSLASFSSFAKSIIDFDSLKLCNTLTFSFWILKLFACYILIEWPPIPLIFLSLSRMLFLLNIILTSGSSAPVLYSSSYLAQGTTPSTHYSISHPNTVLFIKFLESYRWVDLVDILTPNPASKALYFEVRQPFALFCSKYLNYGF